MTAFWRNWFKGNSAPAAVAAATAEPVEGKAMKISPAAKVAAAMKPVEAPSPFNLSGQEIFAPYRFAQDVMPGFIAMDSCPAPAAATAMSLWAANSVFHEGQGFFGYPYLAELAQRAEYRHAAEIWAEHAVRKWIKITGSTPEKRKVIEDELARLKVRDVFQAWALQDHVYGRGQIFLDFDDADRPNELRTELRIVPQKINKNRPLQRLTIVEPMWSAPGTYATSNPLRTDFYRPTAWFVYGKTVHTSRMLTLVSRPVSDMLKPAYAFGGLSLVQLMKPYVDNWLRTRQAVSDMLNSYSVMVLATDMSTVLSGGQGQNVFDRIDMFNMLRDNRGSMAIDKNTEELTNVAVPMSGLDDLQAQAQEQLASVSRIPLSVYLQITPTGLNATSDGETRNFYADVHSYQEKNWRDPLKQILEIVQLSTSGAIDPEIGFQFEPLWEMSALDKSVIEKNRAETDATYVNAAVVSNEEVRERLSNDEESMYHGVDLTDPAPEPDKDDETGDGDKGNNPGRGASEE